MDTSLTTDEPPVNYGRPTQEVMVHSNSSHDDDISTLGDSVLAGAKFAEGGEGEGGLKFMDECGDEHTASVVSEYKYVPKQYSMDRSENGVSDDETDDTPDPRAAVVQKQLYTAPTVDEYNNAKNLYFQKRQDDSDEDDDDNDEPWKMAPFRRSPDGHTRAIG